MSAVPVRLISRERIAEATELFRFEKPAGFEYKAGQAVDIALIDPPITDEQGTSRAFSLVGAPSERELTIATRMRQSAFKRTLKDLPIGARVNLDGPFGSLTLHDNRARKAVFIAGGIGVTPFVSMLRHAAAERLPGEFVLVYSNRRPEEAAFLEELRQHEKRMERFRLVATMTQAQTSRLPWHGETERIEADFLKKAAVDLAGSVCYVAGPPGLVNAGRLALNGVGVDDDDIRSEEFFGY